MPTSLDDLSGQLGGGTPRSGQSDRDKGIECGQVYLADTLFTGGWWARVVGSHVQGGVEPFDLAGLPGRVGSDRRGRCRHHCSANCVLHLIVRDALPVAAISTGPTIRPKSRSRLVAADAIQDR